MKIVPRIMARVGVAAVVGLMVNACSGPETNFVSPASPSVVSTDDSGVAQKQAATGCPAWGNPGGNSGLRFMGVMSPTEAVARWSAQITDAWYEQQGLVEEDFLAARLALATSLDKNGDGLLCVAQNWGADLNPNSHWALIWAETLDPPATEAWFLSDNHVGTSNN